MRIKRGINERKALVIGIILLIIGILLGIYTDSITGLVVDEQDYGFDVQEEQIVQEEQTYFFSELGEIYMFPAASTAVQDSTINLGIYINTALNDVLGFTLDLNNVSDCLIQSNLPEDDFWTILTLGRILIMTKDTSVSIPANQIDGSFPVAYLNCIISEDIEINKNPLLISRITWREDDKNNERDAVFTGANISISVCGNGVLEAGEQCDDNNTIEGDGCSSTCQIEAAPAPGGNGGRGRPAAPPKIGVAPIEPSILEERKKPAVKVSVSEASLKQMCPKGDELILDIENVGIPLIDVDIDISLDTAEISAVPYFRRKIAKGWYNKDNGLFITGAVPSASGMFDTRLLETSKSFDSIGEKQTIQAGFGISPSLIGTDAELKIIITRDGKMIKEQADILDIPSPDAAIIAEQDGDDVRLFTYVSQKSDVEVAFNVKGQKAVYSLLGLIDVFKLRTSHSRFVDLQEDLEPGLYGQKFSKVIEIEEVAGNVINSETKEKVDNTVECLDGYCEFSYAYLRELCSRQQIFENGVEFTGDIFEGYFEDEKGCTAAGTAYNEYESICKSDARDNAVEKCVKAGYGTSQCYSIMFRWYEKEKSCINIVNCPNKIK